MPQLGTPWGIRSDGRGMRHLVIRWCRQGRRRSRWNFALATTAASVSLLLSVDGVWAMLSFMLSRVTYHDEIDTVSMPSTLSHHSFSQALSRLFQPAVRCLLLFWPVTSRCGGTRPETQRHTDRPPHVNERHRRYGAVGAPCGCCMTASPIDR